MLLSQLAERRDVTGAIDRAGDDHVVEVYPGAALPQWSDVAADLRFDPQGYKGKDNDQKREVLLALFSRGATWLDLDGGVRAACIANDDALDALVSSLVARAAARGLTLEPENDDQRMLARLEGWIHLPSKGSLARLAG